jgi:hypothetical protein
MMGSYSKMSRLKAGRSQDRLPHKPAKNWWIVILC